MSGAATGVTLREPFDFAQGKLRDQWGPKLHSGPFA
jgi:hypothetical protein